MLNNELDLTFNYEPIKYRDIKSGLGKPIDPKSQRLEALKKAKTGDRSICDVYIRLGEKPRCFTDKIVWDDDILITLTGNCTVMRGKEQAYISDEDIISAGTFPTDYDFLGERAGYIVGMSVPPIMMKRVVERLIENNIFEQKEK